MSGIMMQILGSGAGGGSSGWWLEMIPSGTSQDAKFYTVEPAVSGNTVFVTGGMNDNTIVPVLEINEDGGIDTQNYISQSSTPGSHYGSAIDFDTSGQLWIGGYLYSSAIGNERAVRYETTKGAISGSANQFSYNNVGRGGKNFIRLVGNDSYDCFGAYDSNSGNSKTYIKKYNSNNSAVLSKAIHNGNASTARDQFWDAYDNTMVLNIINGQNPGQGGYANDLVGFNTSGVIQFQRRYYHSNGSGGSGAGEGRSIKGDQNYLYFVGYDAANTGGKNNNNAFTLKKTDKLGRVTGTYSGTYHRKYVIKSGSTYYQGEAKACAIDSSGNLYGVGRGPNNTNAFWKFDSSGAVQWCQIIYNTAGGNRNASNAVTYLNGVCVGNDDQIYITGYNSPLSTSVNYGVVAKISPDGVSAGTYGNIVVADMTTEELSNTPNESAYTGYQSDDSSISSASYGYSNTSHTATTSLINL